MNQRQDFYYVYCSEGTEKLIKKKGRSRSNNGGRGGRFPQSGHLNPFRDLKAAEFNSLRATGGEERTERDGKQTNPEKRYERQRAGIKYGTI